MHPVIRTWAGAGIAALLAGAPAWAAAAPASAAAEAATEGIWQRDALLGDLGGLRPALAARGITLELEDTEEYLRVVSGGARRGGAYYGLTALGATLDSEQAIGLRGGTLHVGALQIHGHEASITEKYLGALQTASSIEAAPDTRLQELWWQQALGRRANLRLGQLALDNEFMVSEYGDTFMNAMFGWPALPSLDLPDGGPAFPLSALGLRAQWDASAAVTLRAALVDGYPGGHGDGDPQRYDRHGLDFGWHGKPLAIAEITYRTPGSNAGSGGLPGTYKAGLWHHFGRFADPRRDAAGRSLADPASSGAARTRRGDWSLYAMGDQMAWRSTAHPARTLGVFARAMVAPADRNPIVFSANAGLVLSAPLPGRDGDSVGLGFGTARLSSGARALARDFGTPAHRSEDYLEATYKMQLAPWWTLQADAQYYLHPAAAALAAGSLPAARNAWMLGLRTHIVF